MSTPAPVAAGPRVFRLTVMSAWPVLRTAPEFEHGSILVRLEQHLGEPVSVTRMLPLSVWFDRLADGYDAAEGGRRPTRTRLRLLCATSDPRAALVCVRFAEAVRDLCPVRSTVGAKQAGAHAQVVRVLASGGAPPGVVGDAVERLLDYLAGSWGAHEDGPEILHALEWTIRDVEAQG